MHGDDEPKVDSALAEADPNRVHAEFREGIARARAVLTQAEAALLASAYLATEPPQPQGGTQEQSNQVAVD
jgi:hypothetical protein